MMDPLIFLEVDTEFWKLVGVLNSRLDCLTYIQVCVEIEILVLLFQMSKQIICPAQFDMLESIDTGLCTQNYRQKHQTLMYSNGAFNQKGCLSNFCQVLHKRIIIV